jgi:hypothetical protein
MTRSSIAVRTLRLSVAVATLVVGALFIPAGPAQAQATVVRYFSTHTDTFTAPLEGCLPEDLVGTVTLTETSTGQVVDTGKNVYTVHNVDAYDYHLALPDGRYVQSWLDRDLVTFVANPPHTVFNVVTQDLRTIYAADGTPVGTLSIHAGIHITYNDSNGNGTPDPGEIATQLEYFHLRCG